MPSLISLIESGKAGSARTRPRKAWPRTALLRRMRKVRLASCGPSLLCTECRLHLLGTARRILRYSRIGEVKFIKDVAKLSKNQRIQLRNLSVPPGWVGMTNVRVYLSQNLTIPCHNHYDCDVCCCRGFVVRCSLMSIVTLGVRPNYPVRGIRRQRRNRQIDDCTKKDHVFMQRTHTDHIIMQ
jgi:hypothetical protein